MLPITFVNLSDYDDLKQGDVLQFTNLHEKLAMGRQFDVRLKENGKTIQVEHMLSPRHVEMILQGGMINIVKQRIAQ